MTTRDLAALLFAVVDAVLCERYSRMLAIWQRVGSGAPAQQRTSLRTRATARMKRLGWWRATW